MFNMKKIIYKKDITVKKDSNENIENKEIYTQTISEDVLPKVGTTLKQTREKNKMKLTDIAQHLCIRRIYLEAIENNDMIIFRKLRMA